REYSGPAGQWTLWPVASWLVFAAAAELAALRQSSLKTPQRPTSLRPATVSIVLQARGYYVEFFVITFLLKL
ncbi:MAG: hypothetical protein V3T17_14675, partial [Pseudomonadales bacterium]